MNEILDFLLQHWQVSGLLALVLLAYLGFELMQGNSSSTISPEQAVSIINHEHGVVVDVRTAEEFKTGHVLNAINIDSKEIADKHKTLTKYAHKPIILVCARGRRSADCLQLLQSKGFKDVYTLNGGMQAWQDAGLPIITK